MKVFYWKTPELGSFFDKDIEHLRLTASVFANKKMSTINFIGLIFQSSEN